MKRLIVTADDFGMTKSINEGIVLAIKEGIVTTAGLLPTGEAFADAVDRAKALGLKEAAGHLALTETRPTLKSGKFYRDRKAFLADIVLKKISRDQIYAELKNQMELVKNTGIRITNLSSHEHVHIMPLVLDVFIQLAKEYDVPAIRYLHKERLAGTLTMNRIYRALIIAYFEKRMKASLDEAGIKYTDHLLGFLDSGNLTEPILINMLGSLREGTTELVSHPGFLGPEVLDRYRFHINCEQELAALTSPRVKKIIEDKGAMLVSTL